ncbi:MAG: PDZ domain-containing protein [Bdellovibrionales bacterium]|nr:PDZ domain-containing protein [Bdellovibrionales bacterium]
MSFKGFIFSSFVLLSISVTANSSQVYDHWKTSRITFENSDLYFNPVKCFEIKDSFTLSCVEGFNAAARLSEPVQALVSLEYFNRYSAHYKKLQNFGELFLVEQVKPVTVTSLKESLTLKGEMRNALFSASVAIQNKYKNGGDKPFSFASLIRDLRKTVPASVPDPMIVGTAITGQLTTQDPHAFLQPSSMSNDKTEKEVIGVGVLVHYTNTGYDLREIIPGGAAEAAGFQQRDQILAINGEEINFSFKIDEVIKRLLGEVDTPVTLKLKRDGEIFETTVRRKPFTLKNTKSRLLEVGTKKVGVVSLFTFHDENACASIKEYSVKMLQQGAQALVLDVRNNLGGFVSEGDCVGKLFAGKSMQKNGSSSDLILGGNATGTPATETQQLRDIPLVILVNEVSASATEMLAGGLQDYQRAWIVGEKTFGKGSMQDVVPFDGDPLGTHMAMTTGLVYRPSGRPTQGQGVDPDIIIPAKKGMSELDRWAPREFDLFPDAQKVPLTTWEQPRKEEAQRLSQCAERAPATGDYQLNAALEVVNCL